MARHYTHEAICDGLIRLTAERPHRPVPLTELARSLSIAPSLIFRYFATRADLDRAVLDLAWRRLPTRPTAGIDGLGRALGAVARTGGPLLSIAVGFDPPHDPPAQTAARVLGFPGADHPDVTDAILGYLGETWLEAGSVDQWVDTFEPTVETVARAALAAPRASCPRHPPTEFGSPLDALGWISRTTATTVDRVFAELIGELRRAPTVRELSAASGLPLATAHRRMANGALGDSLSGSIIGFLAARLAILPELHDLDELARSFWWFVTRAAAESPGLFHHAIMQPRGFSALCLLAEGISSQAHSRRTDRALSAGVEVRMLAGYLRRRAAHLATHPESVHATWQFIDSTLAVTAGPRTDPDDGKR